VACQLGEVEGLRLGEGVGRVGNRGQVGRVAACRGSRASEKKEKVLLVNHFTSQTLYWLRICLTNG
jgi:hypothetical protein